MAIELHCKYNYATDFCFSYLNVFHRYSPRIPMNHSKIMFFKTTVRFVMITM